jgi:hypothetical protein
MDIIGAVDWFEQPNIFLGWAQPQGENITNSTPCIEAIREGITVGTCTANLPLNGSPERLIAFRIAIDADFNPLDLLTGRLSIRARGPSGQSFPLTIYHALATRLVTLSMPAWLISAGDQALIDILSRVASLETTGARRRLADCLDYLKSTDGGLTILGAARDQLSSFDIPVGTLSPSGVVTVGHEGYLYVAGGTNHLVQQYALEPSSPFVARTAVEWISLISKRAQLFADLGIVYRQLIIPEKASVIPEYFPVIISPPTPLMKAVEAEIAARSALARWYVPVRHAMTTSPARLQFLRKLDSHLSPAGAGFLCSLILKHMALPTPPDTTFSERRLGGGDLADHFVDFRAREVVSFPVPDQFAAPSASVQKVREQSVSSGRHVGARTIWRNSNARIPGKLMVFGNSFFEHGDSESMLSWWFARCFAEYHFVWSPEVDFAYVDHIRPDYVICQTIERYMHVVPKS